MKWMQTLVVPNREIYSINIPCNWRIVDAVTKQNISLKPRTCYRCCSSFCCSGLVRCLLTWMLVARLFFLRHALCTLYLYVCTCTAARPLQRKLFCILNICTMSKRSVLTWAPCKQRLNTENAKTNLHKSSTGNTNTQTQSKSKPLFSCQYQIHALR